MGRCAEFTNVQKNAQGEYTHGECTGLLNLQAQALMNLENSYQAQALMNLENNYGLIDRPGDSFTFSPLENFSNNHATFSPGTNFYVGIGDKSKAKEYTLKGDTFIQQHKGGPIDVKHVTNDIEKAVVAKFGNQFSVNTDMIHVLNPDGMQVVVFMDPKLQMLLI